MKKYLREIEMAGVILAIIGIASSLVWGAIYGGWLCGIGIALFLLGMTGRANASTRNTMAKMRANIISNWRSVDWRRVSLWSCSRRSTLLKYTFL